MNSFFLKYKTETRNIDISGFQILIAEVSNIDELFDELIKKGDDHPDVMDERIPYWTQLWASAIALAQHIVKTQIIKKKMHVLEIGCGLGLPGIIAGKFGAAVTFTDYIKEPLEFAQKNWKLNNDGAAQFEILDWRKPQSACACDLLLASDVAYEKRSFKHLHHAFKKLIKPGGIILMSEPNRQYAKEFFVDLKNKGFVFKSFSYGIDLNSIFTNVNVYEIRSLE